MANTVVWFDLRVRNLEKAVKFYSNVLNVALQIEKHGETKMAVFPHQESDAAGCIYEVCAGESSLITKSNFLMYYNVDGRIQEAVGLVTKFGGKVIEDVIAIGPYGFRAVIEDMEGNQLALHSTK